MEKGDGGSVRCGLWRCQISLPRSPPSQRYPALVDRIGKSQVVSSQLSEESDERAPPRVDQSGAYR